MAPIMPFQRLPGPGRQESGSFLADSQEATGPEKQEAETGDNSKSGFSPLRFPGKIINEFKAKGFEKMKKEHGVGLELLKKRFF